MHRTYRPGRRRQAASALFLCIMSPQLKRGYAQGIKGGLTVGGRPGRKRQTDINGLGGGEDAGTEQRPGVAIVGIIAGDPAAGAAQRQPLRGAETGAAHRARPSAGEITPAKNHATARGDHEGNLPRVGDQRLADHEPRFGSDMGCNQASDPGHHDRIARQALPGVIQRVGRGADVAGRRIQRITTGLIVILTGQGHDADAAALQLKHRTGGAQPGSEVKVNRSSGLVAHGGLNRRSPGQSGKPKPGLHPTLGIRNQRKRWHPIRI